MIEARIDGKLISGIEQDARLIDVLVDNNYKVKGLCGGRGRCATCHVHVTKGAEVLKPKTSQELLTLAVLTGATDTSRLACQSTISQSGLEIALPDAIYFQGDADIEHLVGKPAPADVLHPISAEVLIPKGKLIMRSLLLSMSEVKDDIAEAAAKFN